MKGRCPGCGAPFQSDRPGEAGYLPEGMNPEGKTCQRCFRLVHYRDYKKEQLDESALQEKLQNLARRCRAVFLLSELWNADEPLGTLEWLADCDVPVFLIATKSDLLSSFMNEKKLKDWVCQVTGLPRRQVWVTSVHRGDSVLELRHFLQDRFDTEDRVLFLGRPNAGKSTLLNALRRDSRATASPLPGTTIDVTEYQLEGGPRLLDAPGIAGDAPLAQVLCKDCLTALTPSKKMNTLEVRLKEGQTLMLGGLATLEIEAIETTALHIGVFAASGVTLHLTNRDKSRELIQTHRDDVITPPCKTCFEQLSGQEWVEEEIALHPALDIVYREVGWVSIYGGHGKARIYRHPLVEVHTREQMVPSPRTRRR